MNLVGCLIQAIIIFSLLQCGYAEAQSVGTLRIVVLANNHQHQTPVSLILNGRNILSFSHATVGPQNISIDKDLLAKGKQTSVRADYGRLQQGCEFDFEVSFSNNGNVWIILGRFHAPTSSGSVYIPLGLCDGDEICSSDPRIQRSLDQQKADQAERDRRNIQALKDWLQKGVDEEARMKQEALTRAKSKEHSEPPSIEDNEFEKQLDQIDQEIQVENVEEKSNSEIDRSQTWNEEELVALMGPMVNEIPDQMKAIMREMGCFDKDYLWKFVQFEAVAGVFLHASSEGRNFLTNAEIELLQKVTGTEFKNYLENYQTTIIEQVRFTRYFEQAKDLGAIGIRFTPFGDFIDFCEMATGREFCKSDGAILTNGQRYLAALGIVIGNRKVNNFVADELKSLLKETEKVFDESGKIRWSKVFSEVESGELVKQNKTGLIEQLRKDKNIPEDWEVVLSSDKDGISYSKPGTKKADEVRIMSGNPKNPNANNQNPYARFKKNGQWLDKKGNVLNNGTNDESHIPIDDFDFK